MKHFYDELKLTFSQAPSKENIIFLLSDPEFKYQQQCISYFCERKVLLDNETVETLTQGEVKGFTHGQNVKWKNVSPTSRSIYQLISPLFICWALNTLLLKKLIISSKGNYPERAYCVSRTGKQQVQGFTEHWNPYSEKYFRVRTHEYQLNRVTLG